MNHGIDWIWIPHAYFLQVGNRCIDTLASNKFLSVCMEYFWEHKYETLLFQGNKSTGNKLMTTK